MSPDLARRLCRSLAIHAIETELSLQYMEPYPEELAEELRTAKELIVEAGFDIDELYPPNERPFTSEA